MIDVKLFINGQWCQGGSGQQYGIINPADGSEIGHYAAASEEDIERAAIAAHDAFVEWRNTSAHDRYKMMRAAADNLRNRAQDIAPILTREQGKSLMEAQMEVGMSADIIDWFAEEGRRAYGRIIPGRSSAVRQLVLKEPVGPVAAFSPWNFPIAQAVRKVAAAVAAGCTIVIKGPEDTPASCAELIKSFEDAGFPEGVINLVYGDPAQISNHLIAHQNIRKISFTGSTPVGKQLAALAGQHMKRSTMELGGHAPAIICEDADVDWAVNALSASKFRNAGQICASPSRFLIHQSRYQEFTDKFIAKTNEVKVGDGLTEGTQMGPLVGERRVNAMQELVQDASDKGAEIATGGRRIGNAGFFFEPTVLLGVTPEMKVMNEEPFGPIAPMASFDNFDDIVSEANRLNYGLAAFAFSKSEQTIQNLSVAIESGMISVNHIGLAMPETPFGGIKDSGYGSEGGAEAIEAYLTPKFVTQVVMA